FLISSATTHLLSPAARINEYINFSFILLPVRNAECLNKMTLVTSIPCAGAGNRNPFFSGGDMD
ncbi:MAG: hypothetical protein AAE976_02260, partial [Thermoplasmataceae archaeon]